MEGTGLDTIAKLLGHTTLAMTQRYAHIEMDLLRDAVITLRTPSTSNMGGDADHAQPGRPDNPG